MKKAIVMTLCAAMAVGMIGSVSTVYAADADIAVSYTHLIRIGKDAEEEVPCYAVNKKTFHLSGSKDLLNAETQAEVQLWKYDPSILAQNGFVDSLSLALSFQKPADTFLKKD